ncbi:MAG: hypothetical protein AAF399_25080 [Bacteroidota bacterium]
MQAFITLLIVLLSLFGFLLFRYLRIRFGFKDSNYGGVQHIRQREPKPDVENLALPGSRMGTEKRVADVREEMKQELHIQTYRDAGKKRKLFVSKADIKRSYIIDALLERPKF